jgi:hypothetical protein
MQAVNVHDDSTLQANSQYSARHSGAGEILFNMSEQKFLHQQSHSRQGMLTDRFQYRQKILSLTMSIPVVAITPKGLGVHFLSKDTLPFSSLTLFLCSYCPLNAH